MLLNLEAYISRLKIDHQSTIKKIWDPCRKKWTQLTPEEMIRQLFICHLIDVLGFSIHRIGVEKEIKLEKTIKRYDLIVYHLDLRPYILIECKAPAIPLYEKVIAQVVRYNRIVLAEYLAVTNGQECRIFKSINNSWEEVENFPLPV